MTGPSIPSRLTVVTLGARDVPALAGFYARLGWPAVVDTPDFVCFELRGALLAIFGREALAADGHAELAPAAPGMHGFSLGVNVDRREDVDAAIAAVRAAGGTVTKEPVDATLFTGRSAYWADPEGNHWEVVWLAPGGTVTAALARNGVMG